jgi:hypothetical protein
VNTPAFTSWEQVPLVVGIKDAARILGRSIRSIEDDLAFGRMRPEPMPVACAELRKRHRRQWSKAALQAWVSGDYVAFIETAQRKRRFFVTASAPARVGASR